jgi:hypothetical protein
MSKNKEKRMVSSKEVLGAIAIRRRQAKTEFESALSNKEWSKLPGWDGIDIGLLMAENIVKDCLKG